MSHLTRYISVKLSIFRMPGGRPRRGTAWFYYKILLAVNQREYDKTAQAKLLKSICDMKHPGFILNRWINPSCYTDA